MPVLHQQDRRPYRCARGDRCANAVPVNGPSPCPCQCHGQSALDRRCDVEGGCGYLHEPSAAHGPTELEGGPILDLAGLCRACSGRVIRALDEYPLDYAELGLLLASGESGLTEQVSSSSELRVPIRVSIEALMGTRNSELDETCSVSPDSPEASSSPSSA